MSTEARAEAPAEAAASAAPAPARPGPAWLREPLLHFLLIGAVVFAIDHVLQGQQDDPRHIVVGPQVEQEARQLFSAARGREPDAKELAALRQAWIDNEVLYREGLALQVDKGDSAIRERVIFKALSLLDANNRPPAIDEAGLRQWFEARRAKYDEPARYDFQEAVPVGDSGEAAVRALVEQLNKGGGGELNASLRVFKGRPHANLVAGYGEAFAQALEQAPPGEWRAYAPQAGRGAWRAMRLDATAPGKPADFTALRGVLMQDWTDAVMAEQRTAAVRALARQYRITIEGAAP